MIAETAAAAMSNRTAAVSMVIVRMGAL